MVHSAVPRHCTTGGLWQATCGEVSIGRRSRDETQNVRVDRGNGASARANPSKGREKFFEFPRSEIKDPLHISRDEEPIDESVPGNSITDFVGGERSVVLFEKAMFVDPQPVGPSPLLVNEPVGRVPDGDLTLPLDRYAPNAEPIIDESMGFHLDRTGSHDLEVQPGGSECLNVSRVREESKNLIDRTRQPHITVEQVRLHIRPSRFEPRTTGKATLALSAGDPLAGAASEEPGFNGPMLAAATANRTRLSSWFGSSRLIMSP
jgi:hypothetical protein